MNQFSGREYLIDRKTGREKANKQAHRIAVSVGSAGQSVREQIK